MKNMKYTIDEKWNNRIVKDYLQKELKLSSRMIKSLKQAERGILLNGEEVYVNRAIKAGDVLTLDYSDGEKDVNEYLIKTDIPVDIIYEDDNFTVVNKSANMPTHQSINHYTDTLANALAFRYKDRPYVFRAINRLDKNTSGVVVTANNRMYADILATKLKEGSFYKEYIAIVEGKIDKSGVIDAPIRREENTIMLRKVADDGEYAITEYTPILYCDEISVLRVRPITGRTHQIRVHMKHIGHPIIGDDLYYVESPFISRQALHASKLKIEGIGEYTAPIPKDMMSLIGRYFKEDEIIL